MLAPKVVDPGLVSASTVAMPQTKTAAELIESGVTVDLDLSSDAHQVMADPHQLEQVFNNIAGERADEEVAKLREKYPFLKVCGHSRNRGKTAAIITAISTAARIRMGIRM